MSQTNMHPRKSGPGRRPQRISTARYNATKEGWKLRDIKRIPADFTGAKFIRKMLTQSLTLSLLFTWFLDSGHFFLGSPTQYT